MDVYQSRVRPTSGTLIIGTIFLTEAAISAMLALKFDGAIALGCLAPAACRRLIASRSPRSIATTSAVWPLWSTASKSAPLLEARHATIERLRILLNQILNQVQVSQRHGRKDVVASAA